MYIFLHSKKLNLSKKKVNKKTIGRVMYRWSLGEFDIGLYKIYPAIRLNDIAIINKISYIFFLIMLSLFDWGFSSKEKTINKI